MEVFTTHSHACSHFIPSLDSSLNLNRFFIQLTSSMVLLVHETRLVGRWACCWRHFWNLRYWFFEELHSTSGAELLQPKFRLDVWLDWIETRWRQGRWYQAGSHDYKGHWQSWLDWHPLLESRLDGTVRRKPRGDQGVAQVCLVLWVWIWVQNFCPTRFWGQWDLLPLVVAAEIRLFW